MNQIQSFYDELGYVCYKYFGQAVVQPYYTYRDFVILIDDLDYDFFQLKDNTEIFIPVDESFVYDDFDDIYLLKANEPLKFSFKAINKKDGIVRIKDYEYINVHGKVSTLYSYDEIDDKDNSLRKLFLNSNLSIEEFVYRSYFENLVNKKEVICSSYIDKDQLKAFVTSFTDSEKCVNEIKKAVEADKYKNIDKNKRLLMEINEEYVTNKIKTKKRR